MTNVVDGFILLSLKNSPKASCPSSRRYAGGKICGTRQVLYCNREWWWRWGRRARVGALLLLPLARLLRAAGPRLARHRTALFCVCDGAAGARRPRRRAAAARARDGRLDDRVRRVDVCEHTAVDAAPSARSRRDPFRAGRPRHLRRPQAGDLRVGLLPIDDRPVPRRRRVARPMVRLHELARGCRGDGGGRQ